MSPRVDHRKPLIAFLLLVVVAAVVVGNGLRADGAIRHLLADTGIGLNISVSGAAPAPGPDRPTGHAAATPSTDSSDGSRPGDGDRVLALSRDLTRMRPQAGRDHAAGARGTRTPAPRERARHDAAGDLPRPPVPATHHTGPGHGHSAPPFAGPRPLGHPGRALGHVAGSLLRPVPGTLDGLLGHESAKQP
ncbi:MAG TPA: hypothetical protein VF049_01960 [Nocardioidaceae bacterium]